MARRAEEHGVIFGAPMVRRILAGQKTQTRRIVVLPKPHRFGDLDEWESLELGGPGVYLSDGTQAPTSTTISSKKSGLVVGCPFTTLGDRGRLWVREAFATVPWSAGAEQRVDELDHDQQGIRYRATWDRSHSGRWRSPIYMPRVASRITLEITSVRVQRVKDLTEEDAIAEGAQRFDDIRDPHPYKQCPRWSMGSPASTDECLGTARFAFGNLWNELHRGAYGPNSWDLNLWVWALTFRRVETT